MKQEVPPSPGTGLGPRHPSQPPAPPPPAAGAGGLWGGCHRQCGAWVSPGADPGLRARHKEGEPERARERAEKTTLFCRPDLIQAIVFLCFENSLGKQMVGFAFLIMSESIFGNHLLGEYFCQNFTCCSLKCHTSLEAIRTFQ